MRRLLILFLLISIITPASAQVTDSISSWFRVKPKVMFSFDARRSFIFDNNAKIGGIKIGLDFANKARVGFGVYWLTSPYYRTIHDLDNTGSPDTTYARFGLSYFSPFIEYVIFQDDHWEFSIPFQLGLGAINLMDTVTNQPIQEQGVSLVELSITGHYKVFPWIGIGSGIGYRQMLTNSKIIEESLSSPVYIIKIKVFIGYLYRKVFPKKERP